MFVAFLWLTNDTSSKSYHVKDTRHHQKIKKSLETLLGITFLGTKPYKRLNIYVWLGPCTNR